MHPVYAVIGDSHLMRARAIKALKTEALSGALEDFNSDEFAAPDASTADIIAAAMALPTFAQSRWVAVSDIERFKAKEHKALLEYVKSPNPSTVLCISGQKLDGRTGFGKALRKLPGFKSADTPKGRELTRFLQQRGQALGVKIDDPAVNLLVEYCGNEVDRLVREVEKLALHTGGEGILGVRDVEALVTPTALASIFELTRALGARELPLASRLLRQMLEGGESGLGILAMMARQVRLLIAAVDFAQRGGRGEAALAREVGLPPFAARELLQQIRGHTSHGLCRALRAIADADLRLKSSKCSDAAVLECLVREL